jgi:hypothetical protein
MRYYGKASCTDTGGWTIHLEPHVMIKFKRFFPRTQQNFRGDAFLKGSPEMAQDLEWFMLRFPLEISATDLKQLTGMANRHREQRSLIDQLLEGTRVASDYSLALPPRQYQRVAADVVLGRGRLLLTDQLGLGKQHPVDTKILTPTGYREIGSLYIGDWVIGSTGKAVRVIGIFPQGVKPSYKVSFSDDTSVEAGPEHLWTVAYPGRNHRSHSIVVTTEQIRTGATVELRWTNHQTTRAVLSKKRLYLPILTNPVEFTQSSQLPITPYLTGQLIANGSLANRTNCLCVGTIDWNFIRSQLEEEGATIGAVHVYGGATRAGISRVNSKLRVLGMNVLSRNKRIPLCYLLSSVRDRISLLHGLMDADGSISKTRNRVIYHTVSFGLAQDVQQLVESLAGVAAIRTYDRSHEGKGLEYQIRLRLPENIPPFRLPRKAERYAPIVRKNPTRSFKAIEFARNVESVCIAVDATDCLYATEHAILTHNTCSAICVLSRAEARPALVVTKAHLTEQWREELQKFVPGIRTHILQTSTPYDFRDGAKKIIQGQTSLFQQHPEVLISSYAKLTGWAETLAPIIRTIVFDEVQELRHPDTNKYAAAAALREKCSFRIGLTATPIYNYGDEFFNVADIIAPGELGSKGEFLREWCSGNSIDDPKAFGSYTREHGLMLRRTAKEVRAGDQDPHPSD